jgi:hypothetical protein
MAALAPGTPLPAVLTLLTASGVARSVAFSAYNSVAFADVPTDRMTSANTLLSSLQELGAGLGVAVGALLVRLAAPYRPPRPGRRLPRAVPVRLPAARRGAARPGGRGREAAARRGGCGHHTAASPLSTRWALTRGQPIETPKAL